MKRIFLSIATGFSLAAGAQQTDSANVLPPVEVRAVRAAATAPFAKTNINKKGIEKQNLGQDLPFLLNQTPSVVVNSDAGNGVGYTALRIRGTDGTRINVTLNGIPYNDPESGMTYFVDLPDFASSVNSIQIQRGVGTSTNGSGAFGASINLSTNEVRDSAYAETFNSYGYFNTWKNTLKAGTGLINNHFTLDTRLSRINSNGFIDRAKTDLLSFYLSGAYLAGKSSIRLNIMSGKEKTYQAWNGVPEAKLFGTPKQLRDFYNNNIGTYFFNSADSANLFNSDSRKYNLYTYRDQNDNFVQTHYQLFWNQQLTPSTVLSVAGFLTRGKGYYEEYKYNQKFSSYGLPNYTIGNQTVKRTDLVRERFLDNYFYGQTFSLQHTKGADNITLGGSWSKFDNKHYGNVEWAMAGFPKGYQYYHLTAGKSDVNVFAKWLRDIGNGFAAFGDVQYRYVKYNMNGFKDNPGLIINRNFNFINPKAGLSYTTTHWNAFASYAMANKEPNREDFEAGKTQQPEHETLNDFEAGVERRGNRFTAGATFYYMLYRDQLVLTGSVNDVGAYTRINVPRSYRAGVELQAAARLSDWLILNGGATFSENKIRSFTQFTDAYDAAFNFTGQSAKVYMKKDIAFSPAVIANGTVTILPCKHTELNLLSKYVGRQYLDNTADKAKSLADYFTQDVRAIYTFKTKSVKEWSLTAQISNVFNRKYEPNGYTFGYNYAGSPVTENYYFPMAGTNYVVGINIKL